ncbi:GLPGLI family protein [Porphyromonas levii]|uniref:GLPGLI family protein n=1 Tax=Porphyromonas levii TaxID=28114 RepID=UPI001EC5B36F|nr:GLPGLI family protein [Porphyromonas levii]MBR8703000.1 hypothetical protein [Porphyromonas levii]MBR8729881.1 hypothetical protein [Porphyromonas levii]MBR8759835.1 hypothetical protein [Porphyromonas levii]MBR8764635.1 hypothetical protein [Porphyromonas levii]MBR8765476.1 hypothetical protein [Porphyromonas levii]
MNFNRKIIATVVIGLVCISSMKAQDHHTPRFRTDSYELLDQAHYMVMYELKSKYLSDQNSHFTSENMLLIGKKISKFFNPEVLKNQQYYESALDAIPSMPSRGLGAIEVFQCKGENRDVVIHYPCNSFFGAQLYEDRPNFNWQITAESKELLGYPCQKATCRFRGRNYEAWFTMQLPLNNGPWKFRNLPGLILKVSDEKGDFIFTAKQVNRLKEPMPIVKYDLGGYDKVTRKEANVFVKRYIEDTYDVLKAASVGTGVQVEQLTINSDGTKSNAQSPKITYVGLELE